MRLLPSLLLLIAPLTLSAATREEEAKQAAEAVAKGKDTKTKLQGIATLGRLGGASLKLVTPYIPELTAAIKDKDAKVRGEASRTLALIDPPEKKPAVEAIAAALKVEKDMGARINMEAGLGDLGAMTADADLKKACQAALAEASKTATERPETQAIAAARRHISGKEKKKKD